MSSEETETAASPTRLEARRVGGHSGTTPISRTDTENRSNTVKHKANRRRATRNTQPTSDLSYCQLNNLFNYHQFIKLALLRKTAGSAGYFIAPIKVCCAVAGYGTRFQVCKLYTVVFFF